MTSTPTTEPAFDFSTLEAEVVSQIAPTKTIDDIQPKIRELVDQAHDSRVILRIPLASGAAVEVFKREARDYGYLHTPRWTLRIHTEKNAPVVRMSCVDYEPPKGSAAAVEAK